IRADEEVGGFDVLMNSPAVMGVLESVRSLLNKIGDFSRGERIGRLSCLALYPIGQGTFSAKGHNHVQEHCPIGAFFAKVKQRQDLWMVERHNGLHLRLEEANNFLGSLGIVR